MLAVADSPVSLCGMSGARRSAPLRLTLAILALLAAFAQPAVALVHGATHQREAGRAAVIAAELAVENEFAGCSIAPRGPSGAAADEGLADHDQLHAQPVATPSWSLAPALAGSGPRLAELAAIDRTSESIPAPPTHHLAPNARPSDQPRAPPLG